MERSADSLAGFCARLCGSQCLFFERRRQTLRSCESSGRTPISGLEIECRMLAMSFGGRRCIPAARKLSQALSTSEIEGGLAII
jgi:hypothetical protein